MKTPKAGIDPTNEAYLEANEAVTKANITVAAAAAKLAAVQKEYKDAVAVQDKWAAEIERLHKSKNPQLEMQEYLEAEKKRREQRVAAGKIKR